MFICHGIVLIMLQKIIVSIELSLAFSHIIVIWCHVNYCICIFIPKIIKMLCFSNLESSNPKRLFRIIEFLHTFIYFYKEIYFFHWNIFYFYSYKQRKKWSFLLWDLFCFLNSFPMTMHDERNISILQNKWNDEKNKTLAQQILWKTDIHL